MLARLHEGSVMGSDCRSLERALNHHRTATRTHRLAQQGAFAQAAQRSAGKAPPLAEIRTSDVDLFYKIYDAAGGVGGMTPGPILALICLLSVPRTARPYFAGFLRLGMGRESDHHKTQRQRESADDRGEMNELAGNLDV
jgi:hypothetical protein